MSAAPRRAGSVTMPRKAIAQLIGKVRACARQGAACGAACAAGPDSRSTATPLDSAPAPSKPYARAVAPQGAPLTAAPAVPSLHPVTAQVFIQKAAVNLLSTVLDTPEFLCVAGPYPPFALPYPVLMPYPTLWDVRWGRAGRGITAALVLIGRGRVCTECCVSARCGRCCSRLAARRPARRVRRKLPRGARMTLSGPGAYGAAGPRRTACRRCTSACASIWSWTTAWRCSTTASRWPSVAAGPPPATPVQPHRAPAGTLWCSEIQQPQRVCARCHVCPNV